jgi:filamentous hemagglutinin
MTLPNGKKTVRIELTRSMRKDIAAAKQAAGLERNPKGYVWHHVEDEGTMMLVPEDLHDAVAHSGGQGHVQAPDRGRLWTVDGYR